MKITYFIAGLYNAGGMERVISLKAGWLAANTDCDITIITYCQDDSAKDYFPLDSRVKRVRWNFPQQGIKSNLKKHLTEWLADNPQDICISTYGREFEVLHKINDKSRKIVEFHFCYDVNKHWARENHHPIIAKCKGIYKTLEMKWYARHYDQLVVLTQSDLHRWNNSRTVCIGNPVTIKNERVSDCSSKRIMAVGRMAKQKGFDYLIDCWAQLERKHPEWQLDIFGSGDSEPYNRLIQKRNLERIKIHPATQNICEQYIDSSIYVLSSRFEGFSLTTCEAMTCGLPVVTFDCPSGPGELVEDGVNGFVINRVGDIDDMARAISRLIEDSEMRASFGRKSVERAVNYTLDTVMNRWVHLFNELCGK